MRIADFFAFFSWLFRWKNPFFLTRPSVNDRIYSYRPYIFHAFFGWFDKFFSFFSRAFLYFSFRLRKICCFFHPDHPFSEIFSLRRNNFSCLFYVELRKFSVCFHNFFAFSELFQKKNLLFFVSVIGFSGMSFLTIRIFFKFFSWGNWEIFLPVFIIFALFPGLFKGKILIFRNEFSVRTNIFSLPRGVFPDFFSCHPIKKTILPEYFSSHPAGIFTFPAHFCTNQTRANLRTRNNILSTPPGSLSLIPENLP